MPADSVSDPTRATAAPDGFTTTKRLCDDDGMVSQAQVPEEEFLTYLGLHNRLSAHGGRGPLSEPFPCTGSAHVAGEHIYCTSPAHAEPENPERSDVWPVRLSKEARQIITPPGTGGTANAR